MTNPTVAQIQYDVGDARNITNGTTAISSLLTKSQVSIRGITGTTVGYDNAIRDLADAFVVMAVLGGLGPETVGRNELVSQRDKFLEETERELKIKGYAFDGRSVRFKAVNQ